jgi:hypothetical protein
MMLEPSFMLWIWRLAQKHFCRLVFSSQLLKWAYAYNWSVHLALQHFTEIHGVPNHRAVWTLCFDASSRYAVEVAGKSDNSHSE